MTRFREGISMSGRLSLLILFFALGTFAGCSQQQQDQVTTVDKDDPAMLAAMAEAKQNLHILDENIGKPDIYCAIKVGFKYGNDDDREYCWVSHIERTDNGYAGTLDNIPVEEIGHQQGDRIEVTRDEVADWIVKGEGPVQGNYSLKALLPKMSVSEAAEAKQAMGWR